MSSSEGYWSIEVGDGPLVATAIHDGHAIREELHEHLALDEVGRLREEDPSTGGWTRVAPTRIIGLRSRFEVDLNRPRESAIYLQPADAWGLEVWRERLPDDLIRPALAGYDAFYDTLRDLYADKVAQHGVVIVYDLHTYNHRRDGADQPEADGEGNPQVNIGTGTLADRDRFGPLLTRFQEDLRNFDFPTGRLDVRENVKFQGGQHPRWAHQTFPEGACVIAIEFKKFFMDEWTGEPNKELVDAIESALAATVPGVLEEAAKLGVQP